MPFSFPRNFLRVLLPMAAFVLLAGCAIAKPRTDDPLEKYNRKVYTFNDKLDRALIRPTAVGYRKVTNPPVRRAIGNFFTTIRLPITVVNELLQGRPIQAAQSASRFVVNLGIGFVGLMDPATPLGIPLNETDFGVTLARWGVPEGDYLVLPFFGPSTVRDVWRLPVDSFFDPLSILPATHHFKYGQYYIPGVMYLITLRSRGIDAESFLQSAYDPYVFLRDAYRQRRLAMIYDGNPPPEVVEHMQGLDQKGFDPDKLLDEQHKWENSHPRPTQN